MMVFLVGYQRRCDGSNVCVVWEVLVVCDFLVVFRIYGVAGSSTMADGEVGDEECN